MRFILPKVQHPLTGLASVGDAVDGRIDRVGVLLDGGKARVGGQPGLGLAVLRRDPGQRPFPLDVLEPKIGIGWLSGQEAGLGEDQDGKRASGAGEQPAESLNSQYAHGGASR